MFRKISFCIPFCLSLATAWAAGDWTITKHQNRDYVTFSNVAHFYSFPEYTHVSTTVSLRSERRGIRAQAGTSELYINGVRFVTDFPILSDGDDVLISAMDVSKLIEPIMRPNRLHSASKIQTVVLDPGHGGVDQGASNKWGTEKMFALDVAMHARNELVRAGYKVEMTRTRDNTVSLEDRVRFANRFKDALFVSIHFNYSGNAEGLESYALAPAGVPSNASNESHVSSSDVAPCIGNAQDEHNIALSAAIHAMVLSRASMFDRGVKHARFHVLRDVKLPAVLIECGFLSNSAEGQRIATAQFRQDVAAAIAQGVKNYDAAVNFRAGTQATFAEARKTLPPHTQSILEPLNNSVQQSRNYDRGSVSISGTN